MKKSSTSTQTAPATNPSAPAPGVLAVPIGGDSSINLLTDGVVREGLPEGTQKQPVFTVYWVPREKLYANGYNPNHVPPVELALLKTSILSAGWCVPILARVTGEIIDGFHRWTVSADPQISAMTGGLVPVVFADQSKSDREQMMDTIRLNRARGEHGVLPMAVIVRRLIEQEGMGENEIMKALGMEREEVIRLADRAGMPLRVVKDSGAEFGNAWVPQS